MCRYLFLLIFVSLNVQAGEATDPCQDRPDQILVLLRSRRLHLCQGKMSQGRYRIARGWGGIDKFIEGDQKTPIGTYKLSMPRESASGFHLFIGIHFPTEQQRQEGRTGSNVGVHGPHRLLWWLGPLNTWINWTNGCVAVGSREEIEEISVWVRAHPKAFIELMYEPETETHFYDSFPWIFGNTQKLIPKIM